MDTSKSIRQALEDHKIWVESNGQNGEQFDLQGAFLQKANFESANLEGSNLLGANIIDVKVSRRSLIESGILPDSSIYRRNPYRKATNDPDPSSGKSR